MAEGIVYLVGAGPGDRGLMTERAGELVDRADALVVDRLIPPMWLAVDKVHDVGKRPGSAAMPQEEINELLIRLAREGKTVVRLKGGDPFVFGRGGEEAQALAEAGVRYEVVPGVTAGVAAPAYAGIPVTHRDAASAVAFVTGHEDPAKPESALDWEALARFPGTLVFYMGVRNLPRIAERLIEAGRDRSEPAAVVAHGTWPTQRSVTGNLADIADRASDLEAPAVTVVGPVAALGLAWLERRPLHGEVIAVTRARAQASGLATRLAELGAEVIEAPAIRTQSLPVGDELDALSTYSLVCLTSPNGVDQLFGRLAERGWDARALGNAKIAVIGPGTADALRRHGIHADVMPDRSVAEALARALESVEVEGKRVLIARAAEARDVLPDALRARGADVDVVALYETVAEELRDETRAGLGRATYVTFTSSSTVRFFAEAGGLEALAAGARVVSIGPVTSAAAAERGIEVHVEAERHDIDGLVDALVADAR